MHISKIISEYNELCVYMNGKLIYKRWLDTGQSEVVDSMAYEKYSTISFGDIYFENSAVFIAIKAKLTLKRTEDGGRSSGILSGYRPNHVFEYKDCGQLLITYIGDIVFDEEDDFRPGQTKIVTVRFLAHQRIEKYLDKGRKWWIHEGARLIGEAEII